MQDSYFTFQVSKEDKISPAAFGYWSVRWAADAAKGYTDDESDYWNSFHMYLQVLALFTASYWVYAIKILSVSEEIIDEFEIGFNDSISDLLEPDGQPLSERNKKLLYAYSRKYLFSMFDEFGETEKTDAPFSVLSANFIEMIEYYFLEKNKMDILERMRITNQIAEIPLCAFEVLKVKGLNFHA